MTTEVKTLKINYKHKLCIKWYHSSPCKNLIMWLVQTEAVNLCSHCRFGLYGSPLDPLLFDMEPPSVAVPPTPSYTYSMTHMPSGNVVTTTSATLGAGGAAVLHGGMAPAAMTAGTSLGPSTATPTTSTPQDEVDLRDLMLSSGDKASRSQSSFIQRHVCGLLEVEPLHFTCHATSDATRMERMDTGVSLVFRYSFFYSRHNSVKKLIHEWYFSYSRL